MSVSQKPTHPVPDQFGVNRFDADPTLAAIVQVYCAEGGHENGSSLYAHLLPQLREMGRLSGGLLDELAHTADHHPPELLHRTRTGVDMQRIGKHPAYIELERTAFSQFGLAAASHRAGVLGWPTPLPPLAKYALTYLLVQAEFGVCCPLSMTDSLTRTLRKFAAPGLVGKFFDQLTSQDFDQLLQGAMFMTEQSAGSDVSATETRAVSAGLPPDDTGAPRYRLYGEKWFCSNADASLAMVLARPEDDSGTVPGIKGLSLFLLPRLLDDGTPNAYRIVRLKDKLGTRSMASGEITLNGALAWRVGEAGRGFVQMADMINNSRLSNGMRAAGLMRRAYSEAHFIAHERMAFGKRLIELPLMRRQLQKMLLPTEQARSMMFQTAQALHRADQGQDGAYALTRILTPLIKFRACRDARKVAGDAMEVRGGCGYIEDFADARVLRDAHLGSIWEGTSNIVALDVLRAIRREGSLPVLQAHAQALLERAALGAADQALLSSTLTRAVDFARAQADAGEAGDVHARSAASALYHVTSAAAMAWEAAQASLPDRLGLARLVLQHRVLPRDPLALHEGEVHVQGLS
jgi:acyl-CoA dehydrogenase